jgi:tetratricopeptide (TPR) repeat protein
MSALRNIRIFISSPGDVYEERTLAQRTIERMQGEYAGRAILEPVFWEHEPLVATSGFQDQIAQPSSADIMIAILWSRLGTRLPKHFTRADGSRYDSGTEYEFEEAVRSFRETGRPSLMVYRKTSARSASLEDESALMNQLEQKRKLESFVDRWFIDNEDGSLKAAFHTFGSPEEFEQLLERHLHRLVERLLPRGSQASPRSQAVWRQGSPFRGLATFDFEHAPVFFGRTRAIADVLDSLRSQAAASRAFVLILGMSGGGKSSLARAGVMPMLTRPGVIEGVAEWRRAVYRPSDVRGDLFRGLAGAMLREPGLELPGTDADELAELLRTSPRAVQPIIRTALARHAERSGAREARLALLLDQLEEIFTQDWVSDEDRAAFFEAVDALARSGLVWIVATLRSDMYPRCARYPTLVALKEGAGQYDIRPPTATEIGQMIRLPTLAAGLSFESDPGTGERLDDALRDAAAARPELLPLLQFTLQALYEQRTESGTLTLEAYRQLGGVEGSLARHAESVFSALPEQVQAALPEALNGLVVVRRGTTDTVGRKRARLSEFQSAEARALVEAFIEGRLCVSELGEAGEPEVMVAHEALLWHWPRVSDWVEHNRENLRVQARVERAAERWLAEERSEDLLLPRGKPLGEAVAVVEHGVPLSDEVLSFIDASRSKAARARRLKLGMVASLAVFAVIAAGAALFANQQRSVAVAERARAETEAETAKRTTDFMVELFAVSDPGKARGDTVTAREVLDLGARRLRGELADQPEIRATLLGTIGEVYTSLGLYAEARPLLEEALQDRRRLYGASHPAIAETLESLGEAQGFQAELDAAEANFREAIAIQENTLGADAPEVARSLSGLAYVLGLRGDYEEAGRLLDRSLQIRRGSLGESHPEVAGALSEIGMHHYDTGDYESAEEYLRQALEMRRALFDEQPHPEVAANLSNLALVLYARGDYERVEALEREALAMKRTVYGDAHPEVALGLNNLASTLQDQGKYAEAETMYREAAGMQTRLLGVQHPAVGQSLNNLATLLYLQGRVEEATETIRQSIEIYRAAFGDEHAEVARARHNRAVMLQQLGRLEEAEVVAREALASRESLLGAGHPDIAKTQTALASILVERGGFEEARALAGRARNSFEAGLGRGHWRTAAAESVEGAALTGLGEYESAEALLTESYELLSSNASAGIGRVREAARWLIALYEAWGRPDTAAHYRAELAALTDGE